MQPAPPPRTLDVYDAPPAAAAPALTAPAGTDVLAQLGAWRTRRKAEEAVRAAHAAASGAPPPIRVVSAQVRGRTWWRVVAGPMRAADAQALCRRLAQAGPVCWTRELGGSPYRGSP